MPEEEKTQKDSLRNFFRYLIFALLAIVISLASFFITRRVILPKVFEKRLRNDIRVELGLDSVLADQSIEEEIFSGEESLAVEIKDTSSLFDSLLAKKDSVKEKSGGFLSKLFGKKGEKKSDGKGREIGNIVVFEDITVNTNKSEGLRFVLVSLAIETMDKKVAQEIKDRSPQLNDFFINYFRSKTALEIAKLDFQEQSKRELKQKLNEMLSSGKVDSIYYTKLILQ